MGESPLTRDGDRRTFRILFWLLAVAAAITLSPLWLPILLAAWFAHLLGGMVGRLERTFRGRRRLAVSLVLFTLVLFLIPFTLATISLIASATALLQRALESPEWRGALRSIVAADGTPGVSLTELLDPERIVALVREHGATALGFLSKFFGVTANAVIEIFVFFLCAYAFLYDGAGTWGWIAERLPLERRHLERMRKAFHETGRGIVLSIGLTGLTQAVVATITFAALGVPRALLLGELTFFASFIPSFGTGLVWVPVAAALAISGAKIKALILALVGVFVISTIDNVLRPVYSRWGHLDLPIFVLILGIFGGFYVFGPWGFVLGPLVLRLVREVLDIAREERSV
jgi:predicted PurR-regulated permease PerM